MGFLDDIKKEAEFVETVSVDVGEPAPAEIDVFLIKGDETRYKEEYRDPFLTSDLSGLPQNMKRRASRLMKRDENDAKSKARDPNSTTGYDILQLVQPPYNLDMLAQLYETNSSHNAAVTMKAINIVGLGYRWIENAKTRLLVEDAQEKSPDSLAKMMRALKEEKIVLDETLEGLNNDYEFNEIMVDIWTDVEALGNGYLEIGRNRNGIIGYIGHIPGQTMRVRASRDGFIQLVSDKYTFFKNFGATDVANPLKNDNNPNEIIHFKKYSPNNTYYGTPDIIPALPAVLGDKLARQYNIDFFENKSIPRYAFILKGAKLSQAAEQTLLNYFRNELKGKNHGTLYIPLPAGLGQNVEAEFKALEVGIQQASFIDYIVENRQEILMVHRVPPGKVGVFNNMNLAVSRDADKTFKEQVCEPEQRKVENKINKVFSEFTDKFKIQFLESDIIDADIKSRIHDRYARIQAMLPNEIREQIGLPTTPTGNDMLPFKSGPNEGGPGQKTSDGAKPRTPSPADQTGQRKDRGQAQDQGQEPAK